MLIKTCVFMCVPDPAGLIKLYMYVFNVSGWNVSVAGMTLGSALCP